MAIGLEMLQLTRFGTDLIKLDKKENNDLSVRQSVYKLQLRKSSISIQIYISEFRMLTFFALGAYST